MKNFTHITDFTNSRDYARAVDMQLDPGEGYQNGEIYIANDSRFTSATYNQPLTNFAVGGWNNTGLEQELLAYTGNPIPVGKRFNYKVWTNAEALLSETDDDMRQIGAEFKEVRLGNTEVNAQTINRGLVMALDKDEIAEGVMTEQMAVQYLTNRLKLNQIRRASALLIAAATDQARVWGSARDADMDINTEITDYRNAAGILPNTVLFDRASWVLRITALRALTTAGGFANAGFTEQELASWLKMDNVFRVNAVYQSASSTKTAVGASTVLIYHRSKSPFQADPSNIRYFYSPTEAGGPISAFRYEVGSKKVVVGVQHHELISIVYSGGIQKISPTVS